jgi:beta-galactosidase
MDGVPVDALSTRIGVRSATFDARDGFLLNGVKVYLKGISNHLGFGGVGMAVPDRVAEFQIATLRRMGSNAWRTAHNPVAPELLDFADQYGMLVWSENRFITSGVQPIASLRRQRPEGYAFTPNRRIDPPDPRLLQDAQDMVLRDRNHSCIVIWSLCNELGCVANDENGHYRAAAFKRAIYEADQSRPVTGNTVQSPYLDGAPVDPFSQMMDVQSFSYEPEIMPLYHAQAPWKAVGNGEAGACPSDRGYYGETNAQTGQVGPKEKGGQPIAIPGLFNCARASWNISGSLPYSFGAFVWTGFDYIGETYPLGWPDVSSHYGMHDLAGFPKDSVGYYTAWWRDADEATTECAHLDDVGLWIAPNDWTQPVPTGSAVDVYVSTCAASVELFVNGARQGRSQTVPRLGYAVWPSVLFEPGNITAVGYSSSGLVLASRTILTAQRPSKLRAWVEDIYVSRNGTKISADGQDMAVIGVALEDINGVVVPDADVNVTFAIIEGPAAVIAVANGDPADHSPFHATWRFTFHGLARAFIASSGPSQKGSILVSVSAPNVLPATVSLVAE